MAVMPRLFLLFAVPALSFVSVPWQTQRYYGYDGPWQALTVNIGGYMGNGLTAASQWSQVDLLPGGTWDSFIITSGYCSSLNNNVTISGASAASATNADISCPTSNNTNYAAANGDSFAIQCGITHFAGNLGSLSTDTFADCIEACASTSGCVNVAYSGSACYLKEAMGTVVYDGSWDARLVNSTSTPLTGVCQYGLGWNPGTSPGQSNDNIYWKPSLDYSLMNGPYMEGSINAQNLNIPASGNTWTIQNSSSVAVTAGNTTLPNGTGVPLEIGYLSLGASSQDEVLPESTTNASSPSVVTWNLPGALYNQSRIKSYTYGLQIGAAAYDYPGSLVFGGYDKGRAIGPGTTFTNNPPQLLDIVIGVETGGSPFTFGSMTGLLLHQEGAPTTIPANPDPITPYIHLTQQTCDNLATILPIIFDEPSGYYLWNHMDPTYQSIVTSAAYLGFEFPPAAGETDNVLIKVPFALLDLQLTAPVVQSDNTTYFPCMPYSPVDNRPFLLGRAFLQAAFLGRNWNQQISWLAQAPGPGASRQGLGTNIIDIEDGTTSLQFNNDSSLFAASWEGIWKPLPGGNSTSSPTSTMSKGAKIGAIVGGVCGGIIVLTLLAIAVICLRRRKRSPPAQVSRQETVSTPVNVSPQSDMHSWQTHVQSPGAKTFTSELSAQQDSHELPAEYRQPAELHGVSMQPAPAYMASEGKSPWH